MQLGVAHGLNNGVEQISLSEQLFGSLGFGVLEYGIERSILYLYFRIFDELDQLLGKLGGHLLW